MYIKDVVLPYASDSIQKILEEQIAFVIATSSSQPRTVTVLTILDLD